MKNVERGVDRGISNLPNHTSDKNSEEEFLLKIFTEVSQRLKENYDYSDEQLIVTSEEKKPVIRIPASIFIKLSPSEALAKYLKEEHDLTYHEISLLINRNERSIWANYQRAIKKQQSPFEIVGTISVPVSVFGNNQLSILECLVSYLKDVLHLKNSKIARLLNKNPSNIWTIYKRAKTKEVKK
ncbi:hypothetical protein GOV03_04930 [Candidatus Woesearchaeota archaeon]|nr:hypothetical protein [Candidatus Woesearchaeota archaeon]